MPATFASFLLPSFFLCFIPSLLRYHPHGAQLHLCRQDENWVVIAGGCGWEGGRVLLTTVLQPQTKEKEKAELSQRFVLKRLARKAQAKCFIREMLPTNGSHPLPFFFLLPPSATPAPQTPRRAILATNLQRSKKKTGKEKNEEGMEKATQYPGLSSWAQINFAARWVEGEGGVWVVADSLTFFAHTFENGLTS